MSAKTDEFLDLFKVLEEKLTHKYVLKERRYPSIIIEFLNDAESEPYRDELDLCREVRNLLSHRADVDGEPVVEPSQALINHLNNIIEYVNKPPLAIDFATSIDNVLFTRMDQKIRPLMVEMDKRGFSHVPVVSEEGNFLGVFSMSSIFTYILRRPEPRFDNNTTMYHFRKILPLEQHKHERFLFMSLEATYLDVKREFENQKERSRRLAAIFITQTGADTEPLQGMITPWDILRKRIRLTRDTMPEMIEP